MLKAKYLNTEELVLLHNNPRIIRDNDFLRLCDSVKNNPLFFEARPIIASDRTGELVVIAGNQRLRAAKQVGMEQVPVVVIPGLTEAQEAEIIFRDNISNGEFDWDIVANEFSDFDLEDWGLIGWENNLTQDLNPAERESFDDEFEIPQENEVTTDIKVGDVFQIGNHWLICGDSTSEETYKQLFSAGQSVDLVITDPPYNVDYTGKTKDSLKIENDKMNNEDFYQFLIAFYSALNKFVKPGGGVVRVARRFRRGGI